MSRKRICVAIIITLCILSSNFSLVYAKETDNYYEIKSLAINSPKDFPTTSNWINNKVINLVTLYDINNLLYAYCVDIVNKDTGNYAYMIILAITGTPQILEFHPNSRSPYIDINDKKAYYNGVSQYYVKETDSMFQDLTTGKMINKEKVGKNITNKENFQYSYNAISGYNNLTGVPDYPWQRGCTPTSLGMLIKYTYNNSVDGQTTLINSLANECGTYDEGSTDDNRVRPGVIDYLSSKGISPSFCGFMSETLSGHPEYGRTYNTIDAYQSFINSNVPVVILLCGANGTSPYYYNGFGTHTICGTGYYIGSAGEYVIVHTTQQEGDVYVAYSEYALGLFAWFTLYGN